VNRDVVVRVIFDARSIDAIRTARELGHRWLADHPDDHEVARAMESVVMAEEAYRLEEPFCEPSL
jgi:hypothetical protein